MADTNEKKTYLVNVESNLDEYIKEAAKAKEEVDQLTASNKALKESGTATTEQIEASNAALRNAQKEYGQAKKLVDLQTQANNSNVESRKQLAAIVAIEQQRLGALANQYVINNKGQRVLSQAYIDQVGKVKNAKDAIIAYDKAQSDGRSSIGLYSEALTASIGKFQMMPGVMGSAAGGIARVNSAFKLLAANPVGLVITAIVGALTLLIKAFKGNDEASEKFGGFMKGIGNVIKEVLGRIVSFGKAVVDLFRGDFKGAAEEAKAAFTGLGEAVRNAYKGGVEQQNLMNKIEDAEIDTLERIAQRNKEIAEIKKNSRNMDETAFERSKEFNRAEELRKANLDDELSIQRDRVKLAEMELNNTNANQRTDEQRKKVAEERAKLIDLETKAIEDQTNLLRRKVALEKEAVADQKKNTEDLIKLKMIEAGNDPEKMKAALKFKYDEEVKAMKAGSTEMLLAKAEYEKAVSDIDQETTKKAQAQLQKEVDDFKKAEEEKRKLKEESDQADYERKLINQENDLQLMELENAYEFDIQRKALKNQYDQEIKAAEKTGADVTKINQKYALAQKKIGELELKAKLDAYANFAGNIAIIFGKNTAIGRAAAVVQTTIATYQAATEAYKAMAGIPYVGPALGIVAAAAAVAAGLANVKAILDTKSGLPGDSGGGSMPSAPTAIASTPAVSRTYASATGSSVLSQPQLSQEQLNSIPNQNLLTANDIAKALESMPAPRVTVEDINAKTSEVRKVEVRANV